jgi:hypothetical protein
MRSKRSEEMDDGTVSSRQSQSTKSSVTREESSITPAAASGNTLKETKSKDDSDEGNGKPKGSPSRRSRKERETPSTSKPAQRSTKRSFDNELSTIFDTGTTAPFGQDTLEGFADTTAFGDNTAAAPAVLATTNGETDEAVMPATFNAAAAFSNVNYFESAFEEMDFGADPAFHTTTDTAGGGFGTFDMGAMDFPSQRDERVWDKTPHTDVPKAEPVKYVLQQKLALKKKFVGSPIQNPLNGNIIFAATTGHEVYLHEVDPTRSYVQVSGVVVVNTTELRAKVASKYNATVTGVGTVWNLAAGRMTGAGHNNKLHIAAIVDLKIIEAATSMRVVLVWQSSGSATYRLEHVTTPPSGGDFACDVSNFQVSDGLLFISGSSPKGACIFISKPSVREAWSANFLTGSGSVAVMSISPSHPYLVVALADGSVTVWTYKSALVKSTTNTKTSRKLLFPLCRLDCLNSLSREMPTHPESGECTATADGTCTRFCATRV